MSITRDHIISEIRRMSKEKKNISPGIRQFEQFTGIKVSDWRGRYWSKWSDALKEAGLLPNSFGTPAICEDKLYEELCGYVRELDHFPTQAELQLKRRSNPDFPLVVTIRDRLGNKAELVNGVINWCSNHIGWDDVINICKELVVTNVSSGMNTNSFNERTGGVYLAEHGRKRNEYKIGFSWDVAKRYKDIKIQMPADLKEVHVIYTDDPSGIEAYWHNRFKDKRLNGEWFKLSRADVRSFCKMKQF